MSAAETAAYHTVFPRAPGRHFVVGRAFVDGRPVHVEDIETDPDYDPRTREILGRAARYRTFLGVPILRDGVSIGAIGCGRHEMKPFTATQIELVKTFADQAVIAIENVRLFNETKSALERQTATSEILRVISSSPTNVQPVFDAIVRSASQLCNGHWAAAMRFDGELIHLAAQHNMQPGAAELADLFPCQPSRRLPVGRAVVDRTLVHIPDATVDLELAPEVSRRARSFLVVPMLRESVPIGAIAVSRPIPGPFPPNHIELLKTFADQAVIAIENVRLFKDLQHKNEALTRAHAQVTESLEQQTATSEILGVISSSPTDVQPVFDTIAESSLRLCGALFSSVYRFDGELIHMVAHQNYPPVALERSRQLFPARPSRQLFTARAILECAVVHVPDVLQDPDYAALDLVRDAGFRSALAVPMIHRGNPVGAITVWHAAAAPFTQKHIDLLRTFADQAVIAIENVRLFKELEARNRELTEALEQQTATSEILRVISSSPTDVQPVFDTIIRSAATLCSATFGNVQRFDGEFMHLVAHYSHSPEWLASMQQLYPRRPDRTQSASRAVLSRGVVHVPDVLEDPEYQHDLALTGGFRGLVSVPMLRNGEPIGVITVAFPEPMPFANAQIELLKTFAAQAVIAIENVRLFKELQTSNREIVDKSRQLEVASQHKSEFLANMSHELRTPLNAIIGFSEVLTDRMFGELNAKQEEYLKDIYASGTHLLSLINDILDLSKIEAGRMELELTEFHLPTAIENALMLVRERAGRRSIALHTSIDNRLDQIQADERKVRQVVLNLLSNAIKFTPEGGRIEVSAAPKDGLVEVSVSDTGVGIAPEDQEKVFEEFRQVGTAAKKVEGTGLGLTLCRKFVELHGGRIWVKSQLGAGATFTFTIPVRRGV
jgi:signal transduction histidine kinase